MFNEDGYVHLEELFIDKSIYININKKSKIKIIDAINSKYGSIYNLEKNPNINGVYQFLKNEQKISLSNFIELINFIPIKINLIKNINCIGTRTGRGINNPKIPFNFNKKDGFRIIAAVLGDGSISTRDIFSYYNYNKDLVNNTKRAVIKILGKLECNIKKSGKGFYFNAPAIVGKIILASGIGKGSKVINNPNIPLFIKNGKKKDRISFLKHISDDEGSAQINIPYSYSVRYEFCVNDKKSIESNITKDLREIFIELGYNTTKMYNSKKYRCNSKNLNGYAWAFDVQGKNSLEKFQKEIGFSIKSKKDKLFRGVKAIKKNRLGTENLYKTAIKCFTNVYNKKGKVTKYSLSKEARISLRNSQEWLAKLKRKDFISISKQDNYIHTGKSYKGLKGRSPAEYVLK